MPYQIPFRHLCNLLQINGGDIDADLETLSDLRFKKKGFAVVQNVLGTGYAECALEDFKFSLRKGEIRRDFSDAEKNALKKVKHTIVENLDSLNEKEISNILYDIARETELDPKVLLLPSINSLSKKTKGPLGAL